MPRCPEGEKAPIPIGTACDREQLLVLDGQLGPVPDGETGELYIQGVGLSPGYFRDPEKTRAQFLSRGADRLYATGDLGRLGPDRLFYFLGRADFQVKSRGYRIEIGEIETALNALDCLRESAVVAVPTEGFEGLALCCGYAPVEAAEVTPSRLRQELARVLPTYMLPSRWKAYAKLPKNANGKIDRRRLKEEFGQDAA